MINYISKRFDRYLLLLCINLILLLLTLEVSAQSYKVNRNEEYVKLWNLELTEIDKVTVPTTIYELDSKLRKLDESRRHFDKIPEDHLLHDIGLAVVNIKKANILYLTNNKFGNTAHITLEMQNVLSALLPTITLTKDFTPKKWGVILDKFPELVRFAEYLSSYYAIASSLYYNNIRNKANLEQFMSAVFEASYIIAAGRLDPSKWSAVYALNIINEVRYSKFFALDDEYYAIKFTHVAYALYFNKNCRDARALLKEPAAFFRRLIKAKTPFSEAAQAAYYAMAVIESGCMVSGLKTPYDKGASNVLARALRHVRNAKKDCIGCSTKILSSFSSLESQILLKQGAIEFKNKRYSDSLRSIHESINTGLELSIQYIIDSENSFTRHHFINLWENDKYIQLLKSLSVYISENLPPEAWDSVITSKLLKVALARLEVRTIHSLKDNQLKESYIKLVNQFANAKLLEESGYDYKPLGTLLKKIQQIDKRIKKVRPISAADLDVTNLVSRITQHLSEDDVVLDYFLFKQIDDSDPSPDVLIATQKDYHYGVFVYVGETRKLYAIDLGHKEAIDESINAYRKAMERQLIKGLLDEEKLAKQGRKIRQLLLDPVCNKITAFCAYRNTALRLFVSPAGNIASIPFDVLPIQNENGQITYLIEKINIISVTSPNDISKWASGQLGKGEQSYRATLVGDPAYSLDMTLKADDLLIEHKPASGVKDLAIIPRISTRPGKVWQNFTRLDKTGKLIDELTPVLEGGGFNVQKLTRRNATEKSIYNQKKSDIFLIASHGLFLDYFSKYSMVNVEETINSRLEKSGRKEDERFIRFMDREDTSLMKEILFEQSDPTLLSMIALTGASDTPSMTKNYDELYGIDDGYLTAYEAKYIDMDNTNLVLLIGCQTASSVSSNFAYTGGDAVSGFRQAFEIAGARSIIASLWDVPEQETVRYVKQFFSLWFQLKIGKYEAHRTAQLEGLRLARMNRDSGHPFWWAGFVFHGDPG